MHIIKTNICLLFLILLTSCTSSVWVHRDFDSTRHNLQTIAVMPPQIEYSERMAGSTESKPEYNSKVSKYTQAALNEALKEAGYVTKPLRLSDSTSTNIQDSTPCLIHSQKKAYSICDSIGRLKIKKETYKMNSEIDVLAERANANYLLFCRGKAFSTSEGREIVDAIFTGIKTGALRTFSPGPQREGLSLELLLVDANRAEAIWYNGNLDPKGLDPFSVSDIMSLCESLLNSKL
jgi:hypothetical protein